MSTRSLDQSFWRKFAKNNWERKSIVVKNIESELLQLNDTEVFKLLVAAANQSRKDRSPLGFKFFVNGIRSSDLETMFVLPKRSDLSLLGYHERMERVYQDYCLVCDELLQVNENKQAILNRFTQDLYQQVGFPNRFAEMGLYLGNYRKTPFGVHIDRCGVFSFPVVGEKKFRTWSSDYVKKNPGLEQSFRYNKHKEQSHLLNVKSGDMSYWPSSAWHIAESNGQFTATWSLGVWVDRTNKEVASEVIMTLLNKKLGEIVNEPTLKFERMQNLDGQIVDLPMLFDKIATAIKELTPHEIKNSFRESWMKRLSSHGMKTPPRNSSDFHLNKTIRLRHIESPILWTLTSKPKSSKAIFTFSFADSRPTISDSKQLLKLIKDLNHGRDCKVQDYLRGSCRTSDLKAIKALGQAGAFATSRSNP